MSILGLIVMLVALMVSSPTKPRSVQHVDSLEYPRLALLAQIQGEVKVSVVIEPDGSVGTAISSSGHPILRQAAEENLRRWRFESGEEEKLDVIYRFILEQPAVLDPHSSCSFDLPNTVTVNSHVPKPDE